MSTRNIPPYRDPAVILIDQLKEIYIDGELDTVDTTQWYPKLMRKDFTVGLNVTETGVDDPDQQFYENYVCGAERNYTGYCNPEVDKLVDQQSMRSRHGEAQAAGVGDRDASWSRTAPGRSSSTRAGDLPAAAGQGPDHDGQQHLQRLPLRGPLARRGSGGGRPDDGPGRGGIRHGYRAHEWEDTS